MPLKHFWFSPNAEYTLCGDAFDLSKADDTDAEPPIFAKAGEIIMCPKCRAVIDDVRTRLTKSYRLKA